MLYGARVSVSTFMGEAYDGHTTVIVADNSIPLAQLWLYCKADSGGDGFIRRSGRRSIYSLSIDPPYASIALYSFYSSLRIIVLRATSEIAT